MNNKQELRSLTWKYFWKRKRQEIRGFIKENGPIALGGAWIMSLIMYAVGLMLEVEGETVPFFLSHICPLFFLMGLIVLSLLAIISWLRQNWKLATKDARRELRERRIKK